MNQIISPLNDFVRNHGSDVPLPGSGSTWRRFATLSEMAAVDLSLGRLCEGHLDALAILAEANMRPVPGASYGVWAARSSTATTVAKRVRGGWNICGTKEFCSGGASIDHALVTAVSSEGYLLFDLAISEHVISVVEDSWPATGMANSESETLSFAGPVIAESQVVGPPDFYLERPGFWFGAAGVASCWFGGATGLVNSLLRWISAEPSELVLADLGAALSELETMRYALKSVADEIDNDPKDEKSKAKSNALVSRHIVHGAAMRVLERVASAGGARPLCHDADQSRRAADLYVYLAQHHGHADSIELGRILTEVQSWN